MMEAWQKFATPAEAHKALQGMVGTWDAEVTSWMEPGQPPVKSKGTSENRMALGGRWVESRFTSEMMGQPFEGIGYTGYDNQKKKYMGTWMDNMSTAVMVTEGTMDAAGKVMTSTSTMDDFMTGKSADHQDDDHDREPRPSRVRDVGTRSDGQGRQADADRLPPPQVDRRSRRLHSSKLLR